MFLHYGNSSRTSNSLCLLWKLLSPHKVTKIFLFLLLLIFSLSIHSLTLSLSLIRFSVYMLKSSYNFSFINYGWCLVVVVVVVVLLLPLFILMSAFILLKIIFLLEDDERRKKKFIFSLFAKCFCFDKNW